MYRTKPSFVYGFHGLDKDIAIDILTGKKEFKPSENNYDWLGKGIYFWENNYARAEEYAQEDSKRKNTKIKKPSVLGAAIDLGHCLDLLSQEGLELLKLSYHELKKSLEEKGLELPTNSGFGSNDFDFRKRELDCAVIRWANQIASQHDEPFDTVRAAFFEGEELYPNAGFKSKNHIQIAVLNPNSIKGIFLPRTKST